MVAGQQNLENKEFKNKIFGTKNLAPSRLWQSCADYIR